MKDTLKLLKLANKKESRGGKPTQDAMRRLSEFSGGKEVVFMPYGPQGKGFYARDYRG